MDRRYQWRWRSANALVALLLMLTIVMPVLQSMWETNRYELSATASQLVGQTDQSLAEQLTYDSEKQQYVFNKDAIATGNKAGMPTEQQKASVGASDKSNTKTYALQVHEDFSKGVTYYDTNSQLSFSLVPDFKALRAKTQQGHIVFPLAGGNQAIYTLKNNGLKEDIYVPKVTEDTMSFRYKFVLPKTMEARGLPDGSGGIGIYSADPNLFGDITYGSDKDRIAVEKARESAEKSHLVFGLPAPIITAPEGGTIKNAHARFVLEDNTLEVVAEDLMGIETPIAIDPSVVVTATSDFQTQGNNEGMIDFGTSGQITRGGLTGGTMGSWTTTGDNYFSQCGGVASVAYNGYLYTTGCSGGNTAVRYAAINSNGTLGNWDSGGAAMGTARGYHRLEAYNGYLYAIGGDTGSGYTNTVEYAPIGSNGSISSWYTASSFTTARISFTSAAYNGYLYIMGGYDGSNPRSDVQYAAIKADGSLGAWASTTSFTTARALPGGFAYNGYLYIMGGYNAVSTYYSDAQYAKLNNDGTVGTWTATTSFTTARLGASVTVHNGYAYLMGGTTNITSALTDTQYAQINANGTIGTWRTSSTLNTGVWAAGTVAYNGYLYIVAGRNTNSASIATTQYAAIDRAGKPVAFGTLSNNFTTARALSCSVAYNGYLYAIGGSTSDTGNSNVSTVQYTALNSSTGNNGSWSSTTSLPVTLGTAGCTAYNGYLYTVGGQTGAGSGSATGVPYYIAINSNGTLGASWTASPNTTGTLRRGGVFTYGTSNGAYIYAINGAGGSVAWATINTSTGAIGAWTDTLNMVNTYDYRAYAMVGKYLYAFGGQNGTTAVSSVEYTSLNNDGSINAWTSTTSMNTAIKYTNGTTVNGCIYSVGGENTAGTSLNNVQYACPNANGTISAWYNAPNLTVATTDLGVTSYNGYIYGVGGYTTSVQATTQYAYVNHGGSGDVGSWSSGSTFTTARYMAGATAYNGYLYVAGGHNSSSAALSDVQYAPLTAGSGAVGSFTTDSAHPFTTVRMNFSLVAYNGYMYVMAGSDAGSSTFYKDTQYAPIGSSGALSGSFTAGTDLDTTGRESPCALAYNGYMYVAGGLTSGGQVATVRYAAINSDGSLGTWSGTTSFTTARYAHKCFVANGYFYILGGTNGSTNYNDVQAAPINSNGTLGSFVRTAAFNTARGNPVVGVANGFVYVAGGCTDSGNDDDCTSASSALTDVQYAPVYPGGTLGTWQSTTVLSAANGAAAGTVYDGYLYLTGGNGSTGTPVNTTSYAPLNSNPRTARYSKLIDLGNPVSISSVTYNGVLPMSSITPGVTPIYFRAAGSDKVFGSVTASGAITAGATACLATSQNYVRYLEVTILLDGSGGQAILPDTAGTLSNVTDFTVNYITPHPAPNIRLRHGQTLQTGNLSPLDTCYP